MMTYQDSLALADKLKKMSSVILGVELFGSVVRKGNGRDADFLILVSDELAKHWWQEQRELIRVRWPEALHGQIWIVKKFFPFVYASTVRERRWERLKASAKMLNIDLTLLADSNGKIPDFELFLMPTSWRIGTELNVELMRKTADLMNDRNTLCFLKRIAKDAVSVA